MVGDLLIKLLLSPRSFRSNFFYRPLASCRFDGIRHLLRASVIAKLSQRFLQHRSFGSCSSRVFFRGSRLLLCLLSRLRKQMVEFRRLLMGCGSICVFLLIELCISEVLRSFVCSFAVLVHDSILRFVFNFLFSAE